MQGKLVVAHYTDGRLRKGLSLDVDVNRPLFHLKEESGTTLEIRLHELKALFFVKSLAGKPEYQEKNDPVPGDSRLLGAKRVKLRFRDGERLNGLMNRYPPNRSFFFLLPIDPDSNNLRILANRSEVKEIEEIP